MNSGMVVERDLECPPHHPKGVKLPHRLPPRPTDRTAASKLRKRPFRIGAPSRATLHPGTLGQRQRVLDVNAEVARRAVDLRVAEQDLRRSQAAGRLVDNRRLRPSQPMRPSFSFRRPIAITHSFQDARIAACRGGSCDRCSLGRHRHQPCRLAAQGMPDGLRSASSHANWTIASPCAARRRPVPGCVRTIPDCRSSPSRGRGRAACCGWRERIAPGRRSRPW